eukprot:CAMPEP_0115354680 /NCGR_PEP_ID=MMETSP0270-20121206/98713_1 /TAXON_ID=71861 /ORGANISM="Scrippsiella trochoidea, Strain CCMP3099" /LENGTH=56 /DNA_ID=CAMNT_0002777025 /DNA_START=276 /DNA_END=446 /DNA_ORIENTATION=-
MSCTEVRSKSRHRSGAHNLPNSTTDSRKPVNISGKLPRMAKLRQTWAALANPSSAA